MKKIDKERFEFLLLINSNIICQRYFGIRNYNEDCVNSMELKELTDNLVGMNNDEWGELGLIPDFLKEKSKDYTWGYYKPYKAQTLEDLEKNRRNLFDKEDTFGFQIRVDGESISEAAFTGNYFPPKVRYQVDIKEIIPQIIHEIRYFLSKKTYTGKYGEINLKSELAPYDFEV
jgi:hypothetical protein